MRYFAILALYGCTDYIKGVVDACMCTELPTHTRARRRAREFVLQGLYQWRVGGADEAAIEAQIAVEAASLAADQVLLAEATDQLNRVSRTGSAKFITEDEIQRRRFAVQSNEARVARSTAALEAARVQLREASTELDVLTVRASRDGRILQLNLREGEYANANPPEPLMVLGDTDTLQIRADVDEQNAPMVETGRAATASIKGNAANRFPLKFVRIDPFVLPKKSLTGDSTERVDTRVLQVIFSLEKPAHQQLYVGQQVDVYIEISEPKPDSATSTTVPGSGTL